MKDPLRGRGGIDLVFSQHLQTCQGRGIYCPSPRLLGGRALCPHLSRSFRCSPGERACKLISENVKGLSSLIKCKICLTALEDLRLLRLFFRKGWFELQSKITVVCGKEGGAGHRPVIPSLGRKPDNKQLHQRHRKEASMSPCVWFHTAEQSSG